jgi:hypothetical protein
VLKKVNEELNDKIVVGDTKRKSSFGEAKELIRNLKEV